MGKKGLASRCRTSPASRWRPSPRKFDLGSALLVQPIIAGSRCGLVPSALYAQRLGRSLPPHKAVR